MDFVKKFTSGESDNQQSTDSRKEESSSSGGGFMDKVNEFGGGGKKGEQNEDALDKAVDFVQEKFMGQGDQSNESAAEQAKDEAITDFIRDQYKGTTGSDFPIADKDKKYGA
uniref:DNA damage-responsive protein 48 n=1 Tax=Bionectria ochroleuca TaxID=29856 RepID=A0A8H7NJZ8_BIOOC